MLGNDIVDLEYWEPPKQQHVRYLERVCTSQEADAVRRSVNQVGALATTWASKEAAYKLFSKQFEISHFVPKQFEIQIEERDFGQIDKKLSIRFRGMQAEISIFSKEKWVHAVATLPAMRIRWAARETERCFPDGRKARDESEAVRLLARDLLDGLHLHGVCLQFDGRVPRLVREDGGNSGMDISLSHHGAFVAAAVAWPAGGTVSRQLDNDGFALTTNSEAVCSTCMV